MSQNETTSGHDAHHVEPKTPSAIPVVIALLVVFLIYAGLIWAGKPQSWTAAQHSAAHHESEVSEESVDHSEAVATSSDSVADSEISDPNEQAVSMTEDKQSVTNGENALSSGDHAESVDQGLSDAAAQAENVHLEENAEATEHSAEAIPPIWMITPFCILLLCIAVLPLIPATEIWWESNLNRFIVAAVLGLVTIAYYAFACDFPIALHWPTHQLVTPQDGALAMGWTIFVNAIVNEYIAFIVLLFALFTISGGIRISGDLKASPFINSIILAIGATLASFVGTTGAAMLLIRLLLETNKERKYKVHTIVFFIFCVCNCGGCLLPIGDPPLFLGYLRGVDFLWTTSLWKEWMFVNGILIAFYFLWDSLWFYRRESSANIIKDEIERKPLRIAGLFPNLFCLIGVILAVMFLDPSKEICGWKPWMFFREIVQLLMVCISLIFGSYSIRKANNFNYAAIIEVAALFFGIFLCMQAPLQILNAKGAVISEAANKYGQKIQLNEPQQFFWMTGSLSSVLDNAPTYLVFFETAKAASATELEKLKAEGETEKAEKLAAEIKLAEEKSGVPVPLALLVAVSLGAVFMGSMTYIGNGPNFMVKAIAEQSGVKMPSFFGYMVYSIFILFPILLLMTIVFL
ncbi:MAG: sodium:proton antiporter [Planctomycetia bacterium]|nr:sodium:proton antiporter [Planctomycetia bacterium]